MSYSRSVRLNSKLGFGFWGLGFGIFLTLVLSLVVIGAGCVRSTSVVGPSTVSWTDDRSTAKSDAIVRTQVADGVLRVVAPIATSTEGTVDLYRFDRNVFRFGISATTTRIGVGEWMEAEPEAIAIINGGYFMEDGTPSGFLSIDGERIGRGAFDADKSAIINFDDGIRIIDTSATPVDLSTLKTAMQGYPLLVNNGIPAVQSDSGKRDRRSFIGVDRDGNAWIGVVADGEISLHDLARRLVELDIDWMNVINLDGGTSTGIAVRIGSAPAIRETFGGVPNVIVVMKK